MEDTALAPAAAPRRGIELDPFDFYPNRRSALGGLGGEDARNDPTYAFHTQYQPVEPGRITFSIRLDGLAVTTGLLVLRVLALPDGGHAIDPAVANTAQIPLKTVAERGGEVSIAVEAEAQTGYAIAGFVVEETDARLTGIAITLDRLDHADTDVSGMSDATTRFGVNTVQPEPMLLSSAAPTLALPVSQVRTPAQLHETHYARWSRALGPRGGGGDDWGRVYVLRLLESYGVLAPGARGLALADTDARMARAVEGAGGTLDVWQPDAAAEPGAPQLPETLRGFDFVYSIGLCDTQATIRDGIQAIEQSLACLNVGGIAVHVFRFVARAQAGGETPGSLIFTREDLERLALILIAGNHEIAQFAYGLATGATPRATSFGFAVRKGSF